jgi:hypothetical protein
MTDNVQNCDGYRTTNFGIGSQQAIARTAHNLRNVILTLVIDTSNILFYLTVGLEPGTV